MLIKKLVLLFVILTINCCGQTKSEISKASQMVDDGMRHVQSSDAKLIADRLTDEKRLTLQYAFKIDKSKSDSLIKSKDEIIRISDSLNYHIEKIIQAIAYLHGEGKSGEILNKRSTLHVSEVMIKNKMATKLKLNIDYVIEKTMQIISKKQLNIPPQEVPLKLNLFMESQGQSWEEYLFQGMPYGAVIPIFSKFKNDVILTKLMVLEALSDKVKK